jgi:hemerythrin-like metal-binding protein
MTQCLFSIFDDHRRLVSLAADLERLIRAGAPAEHVRRAFCELADDAEAHFHQEERQMRCHHYPGLEEHTQEHARAVEWFREMRDKWAAEAASVEGTTAHDLLAFYRAWNHTHMTQLDAPLAEFVAIHPVWRHEAECSGCH